MRVEIPGDVDSRMLGKFLSKITTPLENDGCWIWGDKINKSGSGEMTHKGKTYAAHRLAFEWWRGDRPTKLSRICDTEGCVNPWHFKSGYNRTTVWNKKEISKKLLEQMYVEEGMSSTEIAKQLGTYNSVILRHLHEHGIRVRAIGEAQIGKLPHNYRGWSIHGSGYKYIVLAADDPFLCMASRGRNVFEHRLVMARHLGRPLESWEIVHHIDHNRLNNDISNLELIQRSTFHHGETFTHEALLALKEENEKLRQYIAELEEELRGRAE